MRARNSRVLASVILGLPVARVPSTTGARSRCHCTSFIPRRRSLPAAGPAPVSAEIRVQGQLDAGRAIQQHAPQLTTVSWLATRSSGAELAARAIWGEKLVDKVDMLERARDDELWQVWASVVLDDKGDGRVVE